MSNLASILRKNYNLISDSFEILKESSFSRVWVDKINKYVVKELLSTMTFEYCSFFNEAVNAMLSNQIATPIVKNNRNEYLTYADNRFYYVMKYVEGHFFDFKSLKDEELSFNLLSKIDQEFISDHFLDICPKNNYSSLLIDPDSSYDLIKSYLLRGDESLKYLEKIKKLLNDFSYEDYRRLPLSLSHGEFQNTNLIFFNNDCFLIDLDSLSVRPRLVDQTNAIAFLKREGRGSFNLKKDILDKEFLKLNEMEKRAFKSIMLLYFIPKPFELSQYMNDDLEWYLNWNQKSFGEIWNSFE